MYNKLFTKILDSSIWLEDDVTRIVWITLIAAMDEDGMARFSSVANLAHRARVTVDDIGHAISILEAPDPNSDRQEFEGRRIERVPGGWLVLNASYYRELVTRQVVREQTRIRVQRHREAKRNAGDVTPVTGNGLFDIDTDTKKKGSAEGKKKKKKEDEPTDDFLTFWEAYPRKKDELNAWRAWKKKPNLPAIDVILASLEKQKKSEQWRRGKQYIPLPTTWINGERYDDEDL